MKKSEGSQDILENNLNENTQPMALNLSRLTFRNSLRRGKTQSLQRKVKTVTEKVKKIKTKHSGLEKSRTQ